MLKVGGKAPDFVAVDHKGRKVSLKDYFGKKLVLYFYVRDSTPGCTLETIDFSRNYGKFRKASVDVAGICIGNAETHKKFADHCGAPFRLIVDEDAKIAKKFGLWKMKTFMGRKYKGIVRTTFIISEDGKILKIFPRVQVAGHWKEILQSLHE